MSRPRTVVVLLAATILLLLPFRNGSAQSKDLTLTANSEAIVHFREGWSAAEILDAEGSLKHLKMAIDRDPSFGLARAMYVWQGGGPASEQTAELNRAVIDAAKGSTAELLLAMAFRETTEARRAAAASLLRAASELVPSDPYIAMSAMQAAAGGDPNAQLERAKAMVARYPDYAPAYNSVAYASWNAGDHPGALEAAMKQVQLSPRNPNAHDSYAELMQWSGKLSDAATHYQEAVTIEPNFTEGYLGQAEVEALQGHYDKARSYVNQAIAHTAIPAQKLAYMRQLVGIYALARDQKGVIAGLAAAANEAKAQNNARATAIIYSQMATSYAAEGNDKSAHQYIAMANAAMSEMPAPGYYYAAMAHSLLKHWGPAGAAIAAAKSAPEAAGNADRIAAAEAVMLTSQGKAADALALLGSADLTDPLVAGRLAEAHAALGHTAEATKLQQAIMSDYALSLLDFPATNARARARTYLAASSKKK